MPRYYRLLRDAVVVSPKKNWGPQILGAGSIVDWILTPAGTEPTLEIPAEIHVHWRDVAGREEEGWLAPRTLMEKVHGRTALSLEPANGDGIGALDRLRYHLAWFNARRYINGKSKQSLVQYLAAHAAQLLPELHLVVRELGGKTKPSDDKFTVAQRVIRLVLKQEIDMAKAAAAVEETTEDVTPAKSSKKSSKKGKASKSGKKAAPADKEVKRAVAKEPAGEGRRSMAQGIGETLIPLLKKSKAEGADETRKIAQSLADGKTPSAKQMVKLRDGVNAAAAEAREAGKNDLSSELSSANRIVRRVARSLAAE